MYDPFFITFTLNHFIIGNRIASICYSTYIPFKDLLISLKFASLSNACRRSSFKALFTFKSSYSNCCLAASPLSTVALNFINWFCNREVYNMGNENLLWNVCYMNVSTNLTDYNIFLPAHYNSWFLLLKHFHYLPASFVIRLIKNR